MWRFEKRHLFVAPGVLALAALLAGLGYTVYLSLFNYKLLFPASLKYVGLGNFYALASDPTFWSSIWTTLTFVAVASVVELILGVAVAYLVFRSSRIDAALVLLSIPLLVPALAYVIFWIVVMDPLNGILAGLLRPIGLSVPDFLSSPQLALWAIIALDVLQMTPFVVLIVTAGLVNTPREVWQAAAVDGARGLRKFFNIAVPLAINSIAAAFLLRLIDAFRIFVKVALLTRGGPGDATTTLEYLLYVKGIVPLDIGVAAAISVVLTALTMVFIAPYLYLVVKTWR